MNVFLYNIFIKKNKQDMVEYNVFNITVLKKFNQEKTNRIRTQRKLRSSWDIDTR